MKKIKLDDIEKENIFETPSGYFEELPSIIQAKAMATEKKAWYLTVFQQPALRFAAPALLILLLIVANSDFFSTTSSTTTTASVTEMIADLSTEELYTYVLEHADVTHGDLLEMASAHQVDLEIEQPVLEELGEEYMEDLELEDLEELM